MALNNVQLEREVLEGILSGLANAPGDYIVDLAVPETRTRFGKGAIPTLTSGSHFGLAGQDGARLPGGEVSVGPGAGFTSVDYDIELYDRGEMVPYELETRSQLPIPVLKMYLGQCVDFLRVGREVRMNTLLNDTTWGYDDTLAGADIWSAGTGDIAGDISDAVNGIKGGSPNTMIIPRQTWNVIRKDATLLGKLNTNIDRALMSESSFANAIAAHFGIPEGRVFIGKGMKLSTNDPDDVAAATNLTDIYGDYFWVGQIGSAGVALSDSNPDLLMEPTAIARVLESDLADNFDQFRRPEYKAWQVQTGIGEDLLAVTAGLGAIIRNTVA